MNDINEKVFGPDSEKIAEMCRAGLESVFWRQDKYGTGGIVESDERVDEGRKLYWPWCWPRSYIVEPLLVAGEHERVRDFLGFWMKCQRAEGNWLHCYDVRNYNEYPGLPETDNVGYMLWHIGSYIKASNDTKWLNENWAGIEKSVSFLEKNFNEELDLIWGQEEANIPGEGRFPVRYALHINSICAKGLLSASAMAALKGDARLAKKWDNLAGRILKTGIGTKLWDEEAGAFTFGFTEDKRRITSPALWLTLNPFWMHECFDDKIEAVLDYHKEQLYDKDPQIKGTYWVYNHSPLLGPGKQLENEYSGIGVWVGGLPVLIHALVKAGRHGEASEQLKKVIELTNPENKLVPEHVNTMHRGKLGNYSVYPEPYYYVDSGNLLHLSFFLSLIGWRMPGLLKMPRKQ